MPNWLNRFKIFSKQQISIKKKKSLKNLFSLFRTISWGLSPHEGLCQYKDPKMNKKMNKHALRALEVLLKGFLHSQVSSEGDHRTRNAHVWNRFFNHLRSAYFLWYFHQVSSQQILVKGKFLPKNKLDLCKVYMIRSSRFFVCFLCGS